MIAVVVEGDTDLPVARKLAKDAGLDVSLEIDCGGKHQLDLNLDGYNGSAKGSPWFVLRDLDHDGACAKEWLDAQSFKAQKWMCFRIAVRELESWLLADKQAFAAFFDIRESLIPDDPDAEADPTISIVQLSQKSQTAAIRRAMAPAPGAVVTVGPLYEAKLIEFGNSKWSLARATRRSESLRRARAALQRLGKAWKSHIRGAR